MNQTVGFGVTMPTYNDVPPFHPDASFPESRFTETSVASNWPYRLLRRLFVDLQLDKERYGTREWNPLGAYIKPCQTVLLKPNFVLSFNAGGDDIFSVVTHPSILRALIDYVYVALNGEGRIIIADVPQMDCDWEELMRIQRLDSIQEFYAKKFGFEIEVYDCRNFAVINHTEMPLTNNRKQLSGDPAGSIVINLGKRSQFYGLPNQNYYGADYNRHETVAHHHGEIHEYCVSKTMLSADVFLSVPKMKTHKKVGVTLNLKGLVGINTNKNYLVHYRLGSPRDGGDQIPDSHAAKDHALVKIQRWAFDQFLSNQSLLGDSIYTSAQALYRATIKPFLRVSKQTRLLDGGNWYGNDSAWRMTADLARILLFADSNGQMTGKPQRKLFCVVDGIIAGDRMGPLEPTALRSGCLVAGAHPFAVDMVTSRLMGFDPRKIRQFSDGLVSGGDLDFEGLSGIQICCDGNTIEGDSFFDPMDRSQYFKFNPHPGWVGHIEV